MSALPMPRFEETFDECEVGSVQAAERRRFLERVGVTLEQARCGGYRVALFLVGIDRPGNDMGSLEPSAVVSLASRVGERLARSAGEGAESARLAHDRFALLMPRMRSGAQVREAAARMLGTMRYPFRASIGIALFPTDAVRPAALIACAAAALANARRAGRHSYSFYLPFLAATSAASSSPDL